MELIFDLESQARKTPVGENKILDLTRPGMCERAIDRGVRKAFGEDVIFDTVCIYASGKRSSCQEILDN